MVLFQYIKDLFSRSQLGNYDPSDRSLKIELNLTNEDIVYFKEWEPSGDKIDSTYNYSGRTFNTEALSETDAGKEISIKLFVYDFRDSFLFYNTEDDFKNQFLVSCLSPVGCPERFYIKSINYFSDETPPQEVKNVLDYKVLFNVLEELSDHTTPHEYILFYDHKLIIKKSIDILQEPDTPVPCISVIESLSNEINRTEHKEQRYSILKNILDKVLFHEVTEKRLIILIEKINEIYDSFLVSFDLYINEFSYSKLKSDFQHDVLNYFERLSTSVADIRSQVIIISTSAIALSQLSNDSIVKNILIVLSILTATIIYNIILLNQKESVQRIAKEIEDKEKLLKEKQQKFYENDCKGKIKDLQTQIDKQKNRIKLFQFLLWGNFAIGIGLLIFILFYSQMNLPCINRISL